LATIDYGMGEREMRCTAWTFVLYEQEFHADELDNITGDLIADVMGKVVVTTNDMFTVTEDGGFATVVEDYTRIDWNATLRALWAMLRTAEDIAVTKGVALPRVGSYDEWTRSMVECEPDMQLVRHDVAQELQRGLFRAGAAASGKTSEQEEEG